MNTANNKNFHYGTNSTKINDQTLCLAYFWHISPILGAKIFSKKLGCHAQPHKGFRNHAKNQINLMIHFQEDTQTDDKREGWTDPIS